MDYFQMQNSLGVYFRSLPTQIQQELLQSGVVFRTQVDMQRAVSYLCQNLPQ